MMTYNRVKFSMVRSGKVWFGRVWYGVVRYSGEYISAVYLGIQEIKLSFISNFPSINFSITQTLVWQ